ncbi:MAG: MBL fold metallo-hydrolase [Flammeovirgaceae bacterium]|nr:MBL fold metallo-hydrolase [Flammeovirgaceae bacterium]
MKIEQIYTGCLSQGTYYIESEGEVAIIDPLREIGTYLAKVKKEKSKIKYIFETHFHADFLSGHLDLANKSGAEIIYGPEAHASYDIIMATDYQIFHLGEITLQALHTPGHTLESTCYLLRTKDGKAHALFTGDTLFIGDVGRPDLAIKTSFSKEDLAGMLFESLRNKIMPLSDDIIIYPAHGAGSACGKSMSNETHDLLGNQKRTNYALRADMTKPEFIKEVTEGILPPPQYFAKNAQLNKSGIKSIDGALKQGMIALDIDHFESLVEHENALVLDTREPEEFAQGHIPNAIFIGITGDFAPWVGALINDLNQPIVFIASKGMEKEVVTRLARVGYDNALGYLEGGFQAWFDASKDVETVTSISAQTFSNQYAKDSLNIIDVRKPGEFEQEQIIGAQNIPLDFVNDHLELLDKKTEYHVHCLGGYRSMIFNSILKSRGYHQLIDIEGGIRSIKETEVPTIVR